jgi:hypothetical protein
LVKVYNYTIKIAAFSDRLAKLYQRKEVAEASKRDGLESYEDYLLSSISKKIIIL